MKFLIDENLSPGLAEMARGVGYEAMAARDLGLVGSPDWRLLQVILDGDWTLVTNNIGEFRKRYARKAELHAGVVFIAGADAGRDRQLAAFAVALQAVATLDMTNTEVMLWLDGPVWRVETRALP